MKARQGGGRKGHFNLNIKMIRSETEENKHPEEATQIEPFLEVNPMVVDFGTVYTGQLCSLPVKVTASCLEDVTLSSSLYGVVYFTPDQCHEVQLE